jgi:hypothetical protein
MANSELFSCIVPVDTAARSGNRKNIKMGETPFSHIDSTYRATKGNAKISALSGSVQSGVLNGDFNDGPKHHVREGGYTHNAQRGGDCAEG